MTDNNTLTRIGVFYDGNYFSIVSNYYRYAHDRKQRISISGLHDFIREQVAVNLHTDSRFCHIVDAHYFRGRLNARDAESNDQLFKDRIFDDVLMREGITTHFTPLSKDRDTGLIREKGIDVWFALEAFELAIYKRFSVVVLIACDGDYVPLVRKLNTLGASVMLLAWDFEFMTEQNKKRTTRTAQALIDEVTYPLMMHDIIDDRSRRREMESLFLTESRTKTSSSGRQTAQASPANQEARDLSLPESNSSDKTREQGTVFSLLEGFGFISRDSDNQRFFFFHGEVESADFNSLSKGMNVSFEIGSNEKGPCAKRVRLES